MTLLKITMTSQLESADESRQRNVNETFLPRGFPESFGHRGVRYAPARARTNQILRKDKRSKILLRSTAIYVIPNGLRR